MRRETAGRSLAAHLRTASTLIESVFLSVGENQLDAHPLPLKLQQRDHLLGLVFRHQRNPLLLPTNDVLAPSVSWEKAVQLLCNNENGEKSFVVWELL